jgi:hypothetical protein
VVAQKRRRRQRNQTEHLLRLKTRPSMLDFE